MRLLVTGATGYVGHNVVRVLAQNPRWTIFTLLRPESHEEKLRFLKLKNLRIVRSDAQQNHLDSLLKRIRPDVIVHLASSGTAAKTQSDIDQVVGTNVAFPTKLLQAMIHTECKKFINTGSFWEEMDGNGRYRPIDLYAATKRAFQNILSFYADAYELKTVTLRLHGVYGPNDPRRRIFSLFDESAKNNKPLPLSPGHQKMDMVYIEDVCQAYLHAVRYLNRKKTNTPEIFEIGSGSAKTLKEIAKVYQSCRGTRIPLLWGAKPYRDREPRTKGARLGPTKRILKWKPHFPLEKGIKQLLMTEGTLN